MQPSNEKGNLKSEITCIVPPIIELRGIEKIFYNSQGKVEALLGIDLLIEEGEFLSIIGPSGCGKTTMLRIQGPPAPSPHFALVRTSNAISFARLQELRG